MNSIRNNWKYFILWLMIAIAGVICFKNITLTKYDTLNDFSYEQVVGVNYSISEDYFAPIDGTAYLDIEFDEKQVNNVKINFNQAVDNDFSITLYYLDSENVNNQLQTITVRKGAKTADFQFEAIKTGVIMLSFSDIQGFYLKDILVRQRSVDFFQKNYYWIYTVLIIFAVSIMLVGLIKKKNQKYDDANLTIENKSNTRESNFELLRIVCMLLMAIIPFVRHKRIISGSCL